MVKHASGQVDSTRYRQVRVRVKESRLNAWMCLLDGHGIGKLVQQPTLSGRMR